MSKLYVVHLFKKFVWDLQSTRNQFKHTFTVLSQQHFVQYMQTHKRNQRPFTRPFDIPAWYQNFVQYLQTLKRTPNSLFCFYLGIPNKVTRPVSTSSEINQSTHSILTPGRGEGQGQHKLSRRIIQTAQWLNTMFRWHMTILLAQNQGENWSLNWGTTNGQFATAFHLQSCRDDETPRL